MIKRIKLVSIAAINKLSDEFVSGKTTLPWLLQAIGAPLWTISMLVPIRESGSLIPQWSIKQSVKGISDRLILWRCALFIQCVAIASMPSSVLLLSPVNASYSILFALLVMSVARAASSICMKDIQAQHVEKSSRGRLVGLGSAIAGALSLVTAGFLFWKQSIGSNLIIGLLFVASILLIVSITLSWGLSTQLKSKYDEDESIADIAQTVMHQSTLKHLVISRCLMLHSALVAPFILSLSQTNHSNAFTLPYFIAASAVGTLLSAYLWGRLSDVSAKLSIRLGGIICVFACLVFMFSYKYSFLASVVCFVVLTIGYEGVRNGRKTYVLDVAEDDQRTQFVATANTIVGVVLLLLGVLYALVFSWLSEHIVTCMTVVMIIGVIHTRLMRNEK